jgi:AraC-like DNA-binding protein
MIGSFDIHNLRKLLKDFYTAVGIRISIFDDEFHMVTEYPTEAPEYCALIRRTKEGLAGCEACDRSACERAKHLRKAHIYTCHAGVTEAITPIQLSGGVLGYAILAHMIPKEKEVKSIDEACVLAEKYGVKREESFPALQKIAPKTTEQIDAAVKILDAVASYVYISNLVQWKNEDISAHIEKYIKRNLSSEITGESLCEQFHCSRSYLYHVAQKTFGMGIMQYVTYCRIERAKELLAGGKSIAETSEATGFADYNYFCKVFRKYTGTSPSKFRGSKTEL